MDIYCINLFLDDMDLDLKPWDQNGGRVTEEDKIILRTMWRMHSQVESGKNQSIGKKGKNTVVNNDAEIRSKLVGLGYGVPRKRKK